MDKFCFAKLSVLFIMLALSSQSEAYNILVAPLISGFNSRLLNMQKMADMLAQDGHQVSVIMNSKVRDHVITKYSQVISFDVPEDVAGFTDLSLEELSFDGFTFLNTIDEMVKMQVLYCKRLFRNETAMGMIHDAQFDLILADMFSFCNPLISSHLNATTIWYQNYGFYPETNILFPLFPSFSCQAAGIFCTTDDMTFLQRVLNTLFVVSQSYIIAPSFMPVYYELAEDSGLELKLPIQTIMQDRIIILNVDYVLDTPRPTMPHVFTISGLFHKKPSPLNNKFQAIVDQSKPHGVVLMSFGTLVPKFDSKTAEKFAKVLGRLKQQVIWRYTGDSPKGLQTNTHLTDWFPQNDLLANPVVKLFITHCGISSTFESVYNGVPIVAVPLFADQTTNAAKLTDRVKMGIKLDYYTVTEEQFEDGIQEVLSNPVYRENAQRASAMMSDQIVPPVQRFRHLVNFTIKSGGAKHLFHPYAVRMSWFTYFGLDVILFLLSVVTFTLLIIASIMWKVCSRLCEQKNKHKQE